MSSLQEKAQLLTVQQLTEDIFRLVLDAPRISAKAKPGQFVMVRTTTGLDPLLRRPFSIHDIPSDGHLLLLYKVIGKGTSLMSQMKPGAMVDLIGPLGNSFRSPGDSPACLIGGGMGIAPLLFHARSIQRANVHHTAHHVLLGARNRSELEPLVQDFAALGIDLSTATDDGSFGHHGFISELLPTTLPHVSQVYVCGPTPLMAAVARLCKQAQVPCQASLETHMACGLGACLGCTILGSDNGYKHVCKHGPVFDAEEVVWTL